MSQMRLDYKTPNAWPTMHDARCSLQAKDRWAIVGFLGPPAVLGFSTEQLGETGPLQQHGRRE